MAGTKVTFQLLSRNLSIILNEVKSDQNVCKLLFYNKNDPLSENDITDTNQLILNLIKPFAFDETEGGEDRSELRVYFPDGQLQGNQIIGDIRVFFDIIVAKHLWILSNDTSSGIRPYEIAHYITSHFQGKIFNTVGKLRFDKGFVQLGINTQFDCIRLFATMTMSK